MWPLLGPLHTPLAVPAPGLGSHHSHSRRSRSEERVCPSGAEERRPTDRPTTTDCMLPRPPPSFPSRKSLPNAQSQRAQWALKVPSSYKVQFTEGCHRILVGTYTGVSSFAKSATACQYYYPIRFAPTPSQETNCP